MVAQARRFLVSALAAVIVAAVPLTFSFAHSHPDTIQDRDRGRWNGGNTYQLYWCNGYYSYSPCYNDYYYYPPTYYYPTYYYNYYDPYAYYYYYNPYSYYGYNYNYNYNNNYSGWYWI